MANKYTRKKKLKEPDQLMTMSGRAADYVREHLKLVVMAAAISAAIIGTAWGWNAYSDSRARKATALITRAVTMYNQTIIPSSIKNVKKRADGLPTFRTRAAKLKAALAELDKAVSKYGASSVGALARAMRASIRLEKGEYGKAIADYKLVVDGAIPAALRAPAREGLIYAYTATKEWNKALAEIKKLPADWRSVGLYHEGRVLAKQGKTKDAADRFRQVAKSTKSSTLRRQANQRLALLGGK